MAVDRMFAVGLRDVKLYSITSLSTPTYATGVDLPAAATMEVTPTFTSIQAEGDDQIVSTWSLPNGAEWTLEQATALDMSAIEVLLGGTALDSNSGASEVTYWDFKSTTEVPYFGFVGKAIDAESDGDHHVLCYKARVEAGLGGSFGYGAYRAVNWAGKCLPDPYGNAKIFRLFNHKTETAIPSTWPGEAPYTTP